MLLYVAPLLFCAVLGPVLSVLVLRRGQSPGVRALVIMMLSASLWTFGYALEIAGDSEVVKVFWAKFQYLAITTLPLIWFIFSIQYLGAPAWYSTKKKLLLLLAVIPGITLVLVWTNELHRLIWTTRTIELVGTVSMLKFEHGPFFYLYWVYGNLLVLAGSFWLIKRLLASNSLLRWQMILALGGLLFPWVGNIMYVSGINPLPLLDWTPLGFTFSGVLFTLSISRYQMVKVVPVAHRMVFEEMIDAMLVLDRQNRVMDLNLAARKLSGVSLFSALGKDFYEVLPDLRGIAPDSDISAQLTGEVTLTLAGALHYYELQINSLTDTDSKVIGRLVALHDITQRKQEQVQLQKAYAELEDRIQDRTSDLQKANLQLRKSRDHLRALTSALQDAEAIERRKIAAELHDRVGQNLTALNLNLKRMVNKLPAEEHSHAQSILTDSAALLEETTRQVRNVMADLNPPMLEEYGLIPALTWHGDKFCERTGITVKVTGDQPAKRLPERIEMALFRIAQECLNNVAKHSQASTVMIALRITREEIILLLEDNGVGFDSDQTGQPGQQPHWGLITMRERAQSIGGDLSIQASPGEGTRLQVSLRRDSDDN